MLRALWSASLWAHQPWDDYLHYLLIAFANDLQNGAQSRWKIGMMFF
jgi:hypothetical protein